MTTSYWPWWLGGLLLAAVAIAFPLLTNAPLGVSGALARLLRWRTDADDESPALTSGAPHGVLDACNQATAKRPHRDEGSCGAEPTLTNSTQRGEPDRMSNALFLLGVLIGGGLAGWVGGQTWAHAGLSPEFHRLFGEGLPSVLILFGGGALVGFGTRWSGGCTSGHGLSGCGRLQPASLIATAVFFGVAIAVSFLLERLQG